MHGYFQIFPIYGVVFECPNLTVWLLKGEKVKNEGGKQRALAL